MRTLLAYLQTCCDGAHASAGLRIHPRKQLVSSRLWLRFANTTIPEMNLLPPSPLAGGVQGGAAGQGQG